MVKEKNPYLGKWRISEMEMWDQDYVDEATEGHFTFDKEEIGYFQFGWVEGRIDYRIEKCGQIERIEFSWEGQDEDEPSQGRGYAFLTGDEIEGRFYFHFGDDSWFKAERSN